MNELHRTDTTEAGNAVFTFPLNGHVFKFEKISYDELRLMTVVTLEGVEREYDEFSTFEELPAPVRRAVSVSNYRMRSTKTTLEGAMADD